jgi:hypothetical protein
MVAVLLLLVVALMTGPVPCTISAFSYDSRCMFLQLDRIPEVSPETTILVYPDDTTISDLQ